MYGSWSFSRSHSSGCRYLPCLLSKHNMLHRVLYNWYIGIVSDHSVTLLLSLGHWNVALTLWSTFRALYAFLMKKSRSSWIHSCVTVPLDFLLLGSAIVTICNFFANVSKMGVASHDVLTRLNTWHQSRVASETLVMHMSLRNGVVTLPWWLHIDEGEWQGWLHSSGWLTTQPSQPWPHEVWDGSSD